MSAPLIVVDDAIAHVEAALGELGELHRVRAASIPERLSRVQADVLIVRSVTRVDAGLLDRAPSLRLVATATAGTDHLDLDTLGERGIQVASAAGCNAQAVAEWVVAALQFVQPTLAPVFDDAPIGIVGFGNVGSRLARLLRALGREVLACDPPRARAAWGGEALLGASLVEFSELWRRCPILSFHVPLIATGPDRTLAYVDAHAPHPAGTKLIINTSRGAVIPELALDRADVQRAILDVWDGEPQLNARRLDDPKLALASPHVAGYSLEGKIAATRIIHEAICAWLGRPPSWTGAELLPRRALDPAPDPITGVLAEVVDLAGDDARTRALARLPAAERGAAFEALRRNYALRREFRGWAIPPDHPHRQWLRAAGFPLIGES